MTTIIWNAGRLVADSRFNVGETIGDCFIRHHCCDDQEKILTPKHLTCNGRRVLAVAFAGNMGYYNQVAQRDVPGQADMLVNGFFQLLTNLGPIPSNMIVVTVGRNYTLELKGSELVWTEYRPDMCLAIGTGVPVVKDTFRRMSPEFAVASAAVKDTYTGGSLSVWSIRAGIKRVAMPKVWLCLRRAVNRCVTGPFDILFGLIDHAYLHAKRFPKSAKLKESAVA